MDHHKKNAVIIGMLPTGYYWITLAYYLKARDMKCVVVNPLHVKKAKSWTTIR